MTIGPWHPHLASRLARRIHIAQDTAAQRPLERESIVFVGYLGRRWVMSLVADDAAAAVVGGGETQPIRTALAQETGSGEVASNGHDN